MATIQAKITAVEQELGNPWIRIRTDHPQVKRLDTKDRERAQQALEAKSSGQVVLIDYTSKPGKNINPHTGHPYQDNYFNGVLTRDGATASDDGIAVVQPPTRKTDPSDAWRISLAAGAKLALQTMPLMPAEQRTFEIQKQIALAWGLWLYTTPFPTPAAETAETPGAYDEPSFGEDPSHYGWESPPPDDIPF